MRLRKHGFVAACLALGLLAAACGGDDSSGATAATAGQADASGSPTTAAEDFDESASLRWAHSGMPTTLDPHKLPAVTQWVFLSPAFDTLTRRMADGTIEPGIAESWTLSADGMTFDMVLDRGRTFQDGTPIDATGVKANLERAMAAESTTTTGMMKVVSAVEVVDPTTVRLNLTRSGGDLPAIMADLPGMMIAPSALTDPNLGKAPVGSGPYKVVSFTDTELRYERWVDYKGPTPAKMAGLVLTGVADDTARLAAVRSGQLDATFIRANQLAEAKGSGVETIEGSRTQFYGLSLNTARSEFGKAEVRQAIMHAIDREAINKSIYDSGCEPAVQPFPKDFFAYDPSIDDEAYGGFDQAKARDLLAKAGLPNGFSFEVATPSITTYDRLAEVIQAQLGEVGIKVTIKKLQSAQFNPEMRAGNLDAGVGPWDTARPDPTSFFANYYLPTGIENAGKLQIPGIEALVDGARKGSDDAGRAPAIKAVTKAALDAGVPIVPVCIPVSIIAHREGVNGLAVPLLGNYDFRDASISK